MGIQTNRFIERTHEQFICAICLEVAIDPVATNDCDHIFCKECIEAANTNCCSMCKQQLKTPKWNCLRGSIKRIYLDLEMKCLNSKCDQKLSISAYQNHDENCPKQYKICKYCSVKYRELDASGHSCIRKIQDRMKAMEELMVSMAHRNILSERKIDALTARIYLLDERLTGTLHPFDKPIGTLAMDEQDAEEISTTRHYRWFDWNITRGKDRFYIWSEWIALEFWYFSHHWYDYDGWFHYVFNGCCDMVCNDGKCSVRGIPPFVNVMNESCNLITSGVARQKILSVPGPQKHSIGNWLLSSEFEGRLTMKNMKEERIEIGLTVDPQKFSFATISGTVKEFVAKSKLGKEFEFLPHFK